MGLNCEKGLTAEPCCECESCKYVLDRYGLAPVREFNAIELGKEDIKKLLQEMKGPGFGFLTAKAKNILVIDECHGLLDSQAALFLKDVEDAKSLDYFIFCTTDPEKFLQTLSNRFVIEAKFDKVPEIEILKLLEDICEQEYLIPDKRVLSEIVKKADGMPRNAVNGLQQASLLGNLTKKSIPELKSDNNVNEAAAHDADGEENADFAGDPAQTPEKVEGRTETAKDIEVLEGKTNPHILLIAPHGVAGDDDNTGDLARSIHSILDCPTIINEAYRKPKKISEDPVDYEKHDVKQQILNLNRKLQAELHPTYIEEIKRIITEPAKTTVFWIHGIDDVNLTKECMTMNKQKAIDCLIGYGQPDRHSCHPEMIETFAAVLKLAGINGVRTRDKAENYRGHHPENMNQWFIITEVIIQKI
jgi:hypothetical protein